MPILLPLALMLASCGGGGGSSPEPLVSDPPPPPPPPPPSTVADATIDKPTLVVADNAPVAAGGNTVYGTIDYGGTFPTYVSSGEQYVVATDARTDFHVFSVAWDEVELRSYVGDVLYALRNA